MDGLIVVFGLGVGLLVGTTGVGGRSVMTPLLILAAGVQPVLAVGTDLAHGAVTKTLGGWQHLRQGSVSLGISLWMAARSIPAALGGVLVLGLLVNLLAGSLPGVWIGARLSGRPPERGLRLALATVLLAAGLGLTAKAGADIAGAAPLGCPLLAGLVCWIILRARDRRTAPVVPEVTSSR